MFFPTEKSNNSIIFWTEWTSFIFIVGDIFLTINLDGLIKSILVEIFLPIESCAGVNEVVVWSVDRYDIVFLLLVLVLLFERIFPPVHLNFGGKSLCVCDLFRFFL